MELEKNKKTWSKRKFLIITGMAILVALIVVVAAIIHSNKTQEKDSGESNVTYVTKEAKKVTISQTLTAAGKVTGGKQETVELKKKKVKTPAVEENERVKKGEPLVYYTDGTHTDAPYNAIVSAVDVPSSGEMVSDGNYIKVRSTNQLYLRITVPENKIGDISVGNAATVVVNSMSQKEFAGQITEKKDVSNELIESNSSDDSDSSGDEGSDDSESVDENLSVSDNGDVSDEESGDYVEEADESSDDDNSYDSSDDELGDSNSDGESSSDSAYYTVTIKFDNNGKVRPGMSANCVITISERNNLLSVPVAAIFYDKKNNTYVRLANGKDYKKMHVTIGEADANNVEIKSGLKLGDKVQVINYTQERSK